MDHGEEIAHERIMSLCYLKISVITQMTPEQELRLRMKAEVFKAMGQPTRLGIIELLQQGELTVGQIAIRLGSDVPSISKHLSLLRKVSLVSDRKEGPKIFYSLLVPQALKYLLCVEQKMRRQIEQKAGTAAEPVTTLHLPEKSATESPECTDPKQMALEIFPKSLF
jgi:ArsR family transcriptional regulator